jgi:hypothetical protein
MIRAMPTRHGESLEHIDSKRNRYERVHPEPETFGHGTGLSKFHRVSQIKEIPRSKANRTEMMK